MTKPVQYFSADYLAITREFTPEQRVAFLEDFAELALSRNASTKLISIKISNPLLNAFRGRCEMLGVKYQTQIKLLMEKWVKDPH